jgi:membrane protease YdiL (CAAX protease family)
MHPDAAPPSAPATPQGPPDGPHPAPALRQAPERREVALILGLVLVLNVPGGFLQLANLRWGLFLTQVFFIAAPVLLAIRLFYLDGRAVLRLRRPRASALAGAALGTAGLNHLLNYALFWQDRYFPLPGLWRELFEDLAAFRGPADFLLLLLLVGVVPGVCEEILFRGFVHAGLMREFESAPKAILAGALVFAGFHLNPWRFSVLLVIGLFLGFLVHRTGSLLPAMLAHALNNTLSLGLVALGESAQEDLVHSTWAHAGAAACLAAAALLLRRAPS